MYEDPVEKMKAETAEWREQHLLKIADDLERQRLDAETAGVLSFRHEYHEQRLDVLSATARDESLDLRRRWQASTDWHNTVSQISQNGGMVVVLENLPPNAPDFIMRAHLDVNLALMAARQFNLDMVTTMEFIHEQHRLWDEVHTNETPKERRDREKLTERMEQPLLTLRERLARFVRGKTP